MHREVGAKAVACGIDRIVTCGELGRQIANGAQAAGGQVLAFDTVEELLPALAELVKPGETVLVKASHGLHLEQVVQALEELA